MSQDNQFQQYGYDHYLKAPKKNRISSDEGLWNAISEKIRSPMVATIALLTAGAVFTGLIIMAYPSGGDEDQIPIVKADLGVIKSEPSEPGGMEVPYRDSTVLSAIGEKQPMEESPHIENLLAQGNEDVTSKEQALQQAMADTAAPPSEEGMASASEGEEERIPQERGMYLADDLQAPKPPSEEAPAEANNILQKIDAEQAAEISENSSEPPSEKLASAASAEKPKMHAAATSPETMDFVRNVLNENGQSEDAAGEEKPVAAENEAQDQAQADHVLGAPPMEMQASEESDNNPEFDQAFNAPQEPQPAEVEPAAGAASPAAMNIEPGSYYVQLASITDQNRADSEYAKMQKKFSVLSGLKYRVEEANLDKGTFYRIQAGPFSKDSAKSICDAIKAEKPGGCILVK